MGNNDYDNFEEEEFFQKPLIAQSTNPNPLAQYFRIPGLHVKLPTRGVFLPKEFYNPTLAGDIPVYPMKAGDELLLRSPDALMSGYALEKLLASCVPDIPKPRLISTPDLDVILLAIRAATYGEMMDIDVNCPKCEVENSFSCNLSTIMGTITFIDRVNEVRLSDDLIVHLKPFNMESATKLALGQFNATRAIQGTDPNTPERSKIVNESYETLSKINLEAIADSIIDVIVPSGKVTDRNFIRQFIFETSQGWVAKITSALTVLNSKGIDKHIDVVCSNCAHEWKTEIEFDPSSFFG
jgi:hypothetical protein